MQRHPTKCWLHPDIKLIGLRLSSFNLKFSWTRKLGKQSVIPWMITENFYGRLILYVGTNWDHNRTRDRTKAWYLRLEQCPLYNRVAKIPVHDSIQHRITDKTLLYIIITTQLGASCCMEYRDCSSFLQRVQLDQTAWSGWMRLGFALPDTIP